MEILELRQEIEQRMGRTIRTPKDFQFLSDEIFRQQHQTISPSTLKRLWGYFPSVSQPRQYTINLLQRYAEGLRQHIFTIGQTFDNVGDYLHLLGICDKRSIPSIYWSQPLPHHTGIIVWGPEYQHPEWHNEGDVAQLMPTITEWWTPMAKNDTSATLRNHDNYLRATSFHELRITFMKNIKGNGYTFLGIYSLAPSASPQCLVWQRIADHLDLHHLDQLEQLR